jgi:hypothetical protein
VIGGLIIGGAAVAYFTVYGIYIGDYGLTGVLFEDQFMLISLCKYHQPCGCTYIITLVRFTLPAALARAWNLSKHYMD